MTQDEWDEKTRQQGQAYALADLEREIRLLNAQRPQVLKVLRTDDTGRRVKHPQAQYALPIEGIDWHHGAQPGETVPLWPWGAEFDEPCAPESENPTCPYCGRPLLPVALFEDVWGCTTCKPFETWHIPKVTA